VRSISVSVVVTTYNRASLLNRLLQALSEQTLPAASFEVVVVIDGSTDESEQICRKWEDSLPLMKIIKFPENRGQAAAANVGWRRATGRCIAFTDDDCLPDKDWLSKLCAAVEHCGIAGGAVKSPRRPYFVLCHNIAQFHAYSPSRRGDPPLLLAGANMGLRRTVLEHLGGFDVSEDYSLAPDMAFSLAARRAGYTIHFVPEALVCHAPERPDFYSLISYAAAHARCTVLLRLRYAAELRTPRMLVSSALLRLTAPFVALRVTVGIFWRDPALRRSLHTLPAVYIAKLAWCFGAAAELSERRKKRPAEFWKQGPETGNSHTAD